MIGCGNSGMEVSLDLCRYNASPHMVARNTVSPLFHPVFIMFLNTMKFFYFILFYWNIHNSIACHSHENIWFAMKFEPETLEDEKHRTQSSDFMKTNRLFE